MEAMLERPVINSPTETFIEDNESIVPPATACQIGTLACDSCENTGCPLLALRDNFADTEPEPMFDTEADRKGESELRTTRDLLFDDSVDIVVARPEQPGPVTPIRDEPPKQPTLKIEEPAQQPIPESPRKLTKTKEPPVRAADPVEQKVERLPEPTPAKPDDPKAIASRIYGAPEPPIVASSPASERQKHSVRSKPTAPQTAEKIQPDEAAPPVIQRPQQQQITQPEITKKPGRSPASINREFEPRMKVPNVQQPSVKAEPETMSLSQPEQQPVQSDSQPLADPVKVAKESRTTPPLSPLVEVAQGAEVTSPSPPAEPVQAEKPSPEPVSAPEPKPPASSEISVEPSVTAEQAPDSIETTEVPIAEGDIAWPIMNTELPLSDQLHATEIVEQSLERAVEADDDNSSLRVTTERLWSAVDEVEQLVSLEHDHTEIIDTYEDESPALEDSEQQPSRLVGSRATYDIAESTLTCGSEQDPFSFDRDECEDLEETVHNHETTLVVAQSEPCEYIERGGSSRSLDRQTKHEQELLDHVVVDLTTPKLALGTAVDPVETTVLEDVATEQNECVPGIELPEEVVLTEVERDASLVFSVEDLVNPEQPPHSVTSSGIAELVYRLIGRRACALA